MRGKEGQVGNEDVVDDPRGDLDGPMLLRATRFEGVCEHDPGDPVGHSSPNGRVGVAYPSADAPSVLDLRQCLPAATRESGRAASFLDYFFAE